MNIPIVVEDVSLEFAAGKGKAGLPVLANVSFVVQPGEFVSLLGPSGCGKSTLLNIVAGLMMPNSGEVRVGDSVINARSRAIPAGIGFVFQSPRLLNWRTVRRNLQYVLDAAGVARSRQRARIDDVLQMVGLSDFADTYPLRLSGGMQQRVALARALVVEPHVILMDEPFGALDAITAQKLREDVSYLCQESGATVLYVTHNMDEAVFLSDRILLMKERPTSIGKDVAVPFARPRRATDPELAVTSSALTEEFFEGVLHADGSALTQPGVASGTRIGPNT